MDDAFALLCLQIEWGADEAIADDPIDRLRPKDIRAAQATAFPQAVVAADPARGTPGERALAAAGRAATLDELRAALDGFDGCALRDTASNLVFAEGDPSATTLIVGEPPGREEDRSGQPFAGPEGELLDQMLNSLGMTRAALMLTPMLPWRPPGGRPASPGEIAICLPFLHRLITLLQPERIVLFGGTATRAILPQGQSRRRGQRAWIDCNMPGMQKTLPVMGLPGLAEMLKTPALRRDAWAGLRMLRRSIDEGQT